MLADVIQTGIVETVTEKAKFAKLVNWIIFIDSPPFYAILILIQEKNKVAIHPDACRSGGILVLWIKKFYNN